MSSRPEHPSPYPVARLAIAVPLLAALTIPTLVPAPASAGFLRPDLHALASRRTAAIVAGAAMLGTASLLVENANAEAEALGEGALDGPSDVGNIYGAGQVLGGAALGFLGAGILERKPDWLGTGSDLARSLAYTGVVVTTLKAVVHRTRPNGGPYSFPSGHTAAAFAVAPVLAQHFGTLAAIPAYALAVSTAMGRMEDRKHYLSDVVVGAGIGTAVGLAIAAARQARPSKDDDAADYASGAPRVPKPSLGLGIAPTGISLNARF